MENYHSHGIKGHAKHKSNIIGFFCEGVPATAGSKTGFPIKDKKTGKIRVIMAPANKRQKPWMACVAAAAREKYQGPPLTGPIRITMDYFFLRPKSHFGTGKNANVLKPNAPIYHTKRPDLTKLVRAVEDALTSIIWKDDSQVYEAQTAKHYGNYTGVSVTVIHNQTD